MALETKRIVDRFDVALAEIVRLAQQGYALKPLSAKMVGIVLYATMEINTDQIKTGETEKVDTADVKDTQAEDAGNTTENADESKAEVNPVSAKVTTTSRAKSTKGKNA